MFIIKVVCNAADRPQVSLFQAVDPTWRYLDKEEFEDYSESNYRVIGYDSVAGTPERSVAITFQSPDQDRVWQHRLPVEGLVAVNSTVYIMNQAGKTIETVKAPF